MNHLSKRDFPIQSSHTDYTANTCMISRDHCGNNVVFLVSCYAKDVKVLLERVFSKYNSTRFGIDGPSIKGCANAVESLLCYEKWIMEDKPVEEVIAVTTRAKEVLMKTQCRFSQRESTQQWDIQEMHGAFMMRTTQ